VKEVEEGGKGEGGRKRRRRENGVKEVKEGGRGEGRMKG
jgi:hypothetical protein